MATVEAPAVPDLSYIIAPLRQFAVSVASLVLDETNVRVHPESSQVAVRESLRKFGQRAPIVVQKQGMIVRAGNNRLMQAKLLGWTHIAAILVDESNIEAVQYVLPDVGNDEDDEPLL